jgi:hypothetical protein
MSLPINVALVPEKVDVSLSELTQVAAALSKQVEHDFQPIWGVRATVDSFARLEDVPSDYWPIILMKDVKDAAGFHEDKNGQPFSIVKFEDQWSLTASHELMEMLADPFGRRLKAGNLPDQAIQLGLAPRRVKYLVEVCDPSESSQFGYQVNGILVSDFYTPHFFDPVTAHGVRYSFTGAIDAPRKVLDGGYISWEDPTSRHWFQVRMFPDEFSNGVPHVLDLTQETSFGKLQAKQSLRSAIDRVTKPPQRGVLHGTALHAAKAKKDTFVQAQEARAEDLRREIAVLSATVTGEEHS